MTGSSPVMTIFEVHPRLDTVGGLFPQGVEPASQYGRVTGETLLDFVAELPAIHVDREIAVLTNSRRGPCVFVRKPSQSPRRPDRAVRGRDLDVLALGKEVLAGLPRGFKRVDQPQDRAVPLDRRTGCPRDGFIQRGERRLGLGKPPRYSRHFTPSRRTSSTSAGSACRRSTKSTS